jgi:hypothetical protein
VWCSIVRRLGIMDVEPTGFRPRHLTAVKLDRYTIPVQLMYVNVLMSTRGEGLTRW